MKSEYTGEGDRTVGIGTGAAGHDRKTRGCKIKIYMENKNYYLTPENWGAQGIVNDEQLAALVADLRTIQDFEDVQDSEAVELLALTDGRFALIYDSVIEVWEGDCGGADCVYQVKLSAAVYEIDSLAALEAMVDADDCAQILYRKKNDAY